jgi:hypothetical protein
MNAPQNRNEAKVLLGDALFLNYSAFVFKISIYPNASFLS